MTDVASHAGRTGGRAAPGISVLRVVTAVGLLVTVVVLVAIFVQGPRLLYPDDPATDLDTDGLPEAVLAQLEIARLGYQAETRVAVIQLVVAIAGLVAAVVALQQYLGTREKERAAGQLSLLATAMELLASESSAVRVGGLFALSNLADVSSEHARASSRVLTEFIRERRPLPLPEARLELVEEQAAERVRAEDPRRRGVSAAGRARPGLKPSGAVWPPIDVTTALDLLVALTVAHPYTGPIQLSGVDLTLMSIRHAELEGADLSRSRLTGTVLQDVRLTGVNLEGADLRFSVLRRVTLDSAVDDADWSDSSWEGVTWARPPGDTRWLWPVDGCGEVGLSADAGRRERPEPREGRR